jgi:excisionase family DNA binding protein
MKRPVQLFREQLHGLSLSVASNVNGPGQADRAHRRIRMTNERQDSASIGDLAPLLTYRDLARRLGVPVGTVHYWVCRNAIPHVRLGPRSVRFRPAEIERWLDERAVSATGEPPLHQRDDLHSGAHVPSAAVARWQGPGQVNRTTASSLEPNGTPKTSSNAPEVNSREPMTRRRQDGQGNRDRVV